MKNYLGGVMTTQVIYLPQINAQKVYIFQHSLFYYIYEPWLVNRCAFLNATFSAYHSLLMSLVVNAKRALEFTRAGLMRHDLVPSYSESILDKPWIRLLYFGTLFLVQHLLGFSLPHTIISDTVSEHSGTVGLRSATIAQYLTTLTWNTSKIQFCIFITLWGFGHYRPHYIPHKDTTFPCPCHNCKNCLGSVLVSQKLTLQT